MRLMFFQFARRIASYVALTRAASMLGRKQYNDALELLDSVRLEMLEEPEFHRLRGRAYLNLEEFEKSIEDYTRFVKAEPWRALGYLERSMSLARLGKLDQALEDLNKAIELEPKNGIAYCQRGIVNGQLRHFDKAIKDYSMAMALRPTLAEAAEGYRDCLKQLKENKGGADEWH